MNFGLKNVTKAFPGVKALDDVSLSFSSGEIHALLGENGAGKSTALKIMCGIYQADEGNVFLDDRSLKLKDYHDAIEQGISIVHQEIQVVPTTNVAENILLDKLDSYSRNGVVNWKEVHSVARKYMDIVGLNVDSKDNIAHLSPAQKQMVQIAKAISSHAKVILFDEPSSSLTAFETANLFKLIKELKEQGKILIFISHKLEEVLEICDKVTVLRDGKYVGTESCAGMTKQQLIQMMIGRSIRDVDYGSLDIQDEVTLEVRNLYQKGRFENINFQLHRGEILGFYGLVGAGRTELAKIIIGEDQYDKGEILVNGKTAHIRSMSDAVNKYRIGYVSENRKEEGLIQEASVLTNIGITCWNDIASTPLQIIDLQKEKNMQKQLSICFR